MNLPFLKPLKIRLNYKYLLIYIFLLFPIYAYGDNNSDIDELRKYFQSEINQNSQFEVLPSTYAEFNPIGGFADGRYKLVAYRIIQLDENIYRLDLLFRKKKGMFSFNEKVSYPFYYDGYVIAFKTPKGKFKYRLQNINLLKKKGIAYQSVNVVLPAEQRGRVYLKMRIYISYWFY
jgi:hypothetical protein